MLFLNVLKMQHSRFKNPLEVIDEGVKYNMLHNDMRSWIPIEKAEPTTDGRFEVTVKNRRGKFSVQHSVYCRDAKYSKWSVGNVIAWRTLPEPYKPINDSKQMP